MLVIVSRSSVSYFQCELLPGRNYYWALPAGLPPWYMSKILPYFYLHSKYSQNCTPPLMKTLCSIFLQCSVPSCDQKPHMYYRVCCCQRLHTEVRKLVYSNSESGERDERDKSVYYYYMCTVVLVQKLPTLNSSSFSVEVPTIIRKVFLGFLRAPWGISKIIISTSKRQLQNSVFFHMLGGMYIVGCSHYIFFPKM